ncbi:LEM domain,LEM/LEM-like domain [Cinara cedri]|uniref:LEM domain,LEM/LEM-like domain n=1 Tax=Cinara cedri TaxID=506608 RepID=A0A5E4M3U9_9HEMI|nr:LEM domain,LEM/LEM-like domain [Cinara cedri]
MSLNGALSDIDLKSKLAYYGIVTPITNTTREVLLRKLQKLESSSINQQINQQITSNDTEAMDTTSNDMNEYEILKGISELGFTAVALTDTTRPLLSNIIRKRNK